jgi:hypothetical protein
MNNSKGAIGCIGCGTSLGCFFPLALVLGLVLAVAAGSYFDESYFWGSEDTWMVVFFGTLTIAALIMGLIHAALGAWGLFGFFDQDVTLDELNLLEPIPHVDEEQDTDEEQA